MNERKITMADMAIFPRALLRKFITLYKDLPCLWDRNCPAYKHKHKRHEAISKLTELLQQQFPRATRVHVLRKIESMRACVRREYKRVLDSRAKASHPDEVYTPQLWYYELCLFMFGEDGNNYQGRRGTTDENAEPEEETTGYLDEDDEMPFEQSMESYPAEYKVSTSMVESADNSSGQKRYTLHDEAAASSKRHCTEIEDEYDAIGSKRVCNSQGPLPPINDSTQLRNGLQGCNFASGKIILTFTKATLCLPTNSRYSPMRWSRSEESYYLGINVAAKLRALPANMRILAEKLVNDVLFQAQMNCLSSATVITTPDPFKPDV